MTSVPHSQSEPIVQLAFGQVRHLRARPKPHGFAYRAFFLRIAIDRLEQQQSSAIAGRWFGLNRPGWLSFWAKDHGDGSGDLRGWIQSILADHQIVADGAIWLHAFARVFGYQFKPVSFWFCHNRAGELAAVLAEVNNTFGEKHLYLLADPNQALRWGQTLNADKAFHVSPFFQVQGRYEFRFLNNAQRAIARIDYLDQNGLLLNTSLSGEFTAPTRKAVRRAVFGYPFFSLAVVVRIHWHAIRLWLGKRIAYVPKPNPPKHPLTKGQS
jgi:uncharacterized protein